jgi:thioredoxin-related protein/YHS domain-containing protein
MHAKLGALSIGLALCLTTSVSLGASAIQWQPTLERAQVVAAHSNRLVLVHFWGNGCPPCAWMEREVFTRQDVASSVDRGYVAVKINKDQFPDVARQFGVAAVPTDVIITPQGQVLGNYVGKVPAAEFVGRLNQISQRVLAPSGQGYAVQTQGPVNRSLAQTQAYAQQVPNQQPPHPNAGYGMGAPVGSQPGPYPQQGADPAMAAQMNPRYAEQYGPGPSVSPAPGPGQNPAQYGMNPGQPMTAGMGTASYGANPYPPNSQMPPMDPAAQVPGHAAPQQPATAPVDGNPPLALEGFCSVSLEKTMRVDPEPKWIPGDPRWGLRHEGRTYLFAGPDEQQAFFSNPNLYAPVLSGNDIVLHAEQRRQMPGVREFGARWRDRVYLFSSRESFEKFQANPTFYENALPGGQQAAGPGEMPGQQIGATMNPPHGYR